MYAIVVICWLVAMSLFSAGIFADMRDASPTITKALYYTGISLSGVAVIALAVEVATSG